MSTEAERTGPQRNKKANRARHPILVRLTEEVDVRRLHHRKASRASGNSDQMIARLRQGCVPAFTAVDGLARFLGYELALIPVGSATAACAWALRLRGEVVDVTLDAKKAQAWRERGWEAVALVEGGEREKMA